MSARPPEDLVGTIIDGRYQVRSKLGAGAMGTVYLAEHVDIHKEVALKVLNPELSEREHIRKRFLREAQSTARMDHPCIVQVTDFGTTDEHALFMVMERVHGRALSALKASEVNFERAIWLVSRILEALDHAHRRGVIHRDLKPDNIMLVEREGEDNEVKILDFGLAMILESESGRPLTGPGAVFGTPRYMSPEQASGEAVDGRSDLYAVGVMLAEVLSGKVLFEGETAGDVLKKQITTTPILEFDAPEGWDGDLLKSVLHKVLSKHPVERYDTARAFRDAIDACRIEVTNEEDVAAFVGSTPPTPIPEIKKTKWWKPTAVLGLVIALPFTWNMLQQPNVEDLENALAEGNLPRAAQLAEEALRSHPKDGRVYLLAGHVDFARGDLKQAAGSYELALERSPEVAEDGRFQLNMRALIEDKSDLVKDLLEELAEHGDSRSTPLFVHAAREAHSFQLRRMAYERLETLKEFEDLDRFDWLSEQLERNNTRVCKIRKWYVSRLIELDDARARPLLEKEGKGRRRKTGCMNEMIATALSQMPAPTEATP